jgi:lipid-A-disaccharide synthase
MRYYLIAGEASGDLHGSNLVRALRAEDPEADIRAWGGDLMQAAGANVVKHYRDLAFMGFVEVIKNLPTILHNMRFCKSDILQYQPDVLILIDYPGFNLRIAEWAKTQGLRVFYYISPQLWAWHSSRVKIIRRAVERMYVILPFEQAFYQKYDYEVDFPGHPLLDVVDQHPNDSDLREAYHLPDRPLIALLPGSRRQEISRILLLMLEVIPRFPDYHFVIAGAPAIPEDFYHQLLAATKAGQQVTLIRNRTYDLLRQAKAAVVTSGTATLETALFGVPEVVCYRGGKLSYWIARRVVNVPFISLVNLIVNRKLVEELIQDDCNADNISAELRRLLDPAAAQSIQTGYAELREQLGTAGASARAAKMMVERIKDQG